MADIQQKVLDILERDGQIPDSRTLSIHDNSENSATLQAALSSLRSRDMIEYQNHEDLSYFLKPEGEHILLHGSHEARVWAATPVAGGVPKSAAEIAAAVGAESAKIGQGKALQLKWIKKESSGFVKASDAIVDTVQDTLKRLVASNGTDIAEKSISDLQKRKLVAQRKSIWFSVTKGPKFSNTIAKLETDLSVEMLSSGSWKDATFKEYNFEATGVPTNGGALHPLLKVREEFRNIFLEMGFSEMPTSQFVESCFWNFDSLFVPQQHPAREAQDTFYLSDPSTSLVPEKDYYNRVVKVHSEGGYGSLGYRAPWSEEESRRLVLRTHTTARSAYLLRTIATQEGGFKPAKLFSIDRVFRNEATDNTHLAEFHQVEGVVADYNLTLPDLMGFMKTFFKKMGLTNLRFKPAYNPYTEPSMEIFAFHPILEKWVEIGNSGMFRPEMLEPMGIPKDVRVHGWGLSLERPTMIRYGIKNIRTLVGHKVNIEWVENSPAVRF